ncbi:unnamed protein product, partial [Anisakis simplex]|uniref:P66_CC domain-containing protein n=1 Tax=Anisakis simplex TaxID=6269 RepID=A0A0M3KHX7_ANISI
IKQNVEHAADPTNNQTPSEAITPQPQQAKAKAAAELPRTTPPTASPSTNLYPALIPSAPPASVPEEEGKNSQTPEKVREQSVSAKKRLPTSKECPKTAEEGLSSPPSETVPKGKSGRTAADIHALLTEPVRVPTADIRARAEYLRMQRDKLLELKKVQRQKIFQETTQCSASERPKTAKAARGMLSGRAVQSRDGPANEDIIAARRELANKLKNEVVKQ